MSTATTGTALITTGRVGINNAAPTVPLDVAGAARISGNLDMSSSGQIVNLVTPTNNQDAATKSYVDTKFTTVPTPTNTQDAANKGYVDTSIPIGGIIMWSGVGVTLPSNWKFCDGAVYNGITTPDLRGRFVLSSGSGSGLTPRTINTSGGVETVALTTAQMPSHSHTYSAYTKQGTAFCASGDGRAPPLRDENHRTNLETVATGSGSAHENMPPFYVLAFIMRIS
jgi:hypothetical protein